MGTSYHSHASMVRPYTKSVVLGGALTLFPVPESLTQAYARNIQMAIRRAEEAAYIAGCRDTQRSIRKALGVKG